MPTTRHCSECGKPLAADGGCPVCALKRALALSGQGAEAQVIEQAGDGIGRYKLIEKIGEGGYGVVYMAEQAAPIRRRVALKVVKLGMDTKQVIARFEAERQALALMDHPNIAKVLDAGATDTGRPYFVMELVRGVRITDYCDLHHLSIKERLDLFMRVCQAVQHAHQKGIIHRDLKPSNILVTELDGVAVPKVIDFGIAKATSQQLLTEKTLFTAFQQFIGTPAYMSPEQAGLSGADIDTRSDIYSLGVLLYELLTGHVPFEKKELLQAGIDEMRRVIREKEPPKPSTRLRELVAADVRRLTSKSETRDQRSEDERVALRRLLQEKKELIHRLHGDLDWIVMKCLEKDRARRYETASGFAQDIERHLNHEPVTAGAPGAAYRLGKFVRRHFFGLATATALVLMLLTGIVLSIWQAEQARRAEKQTLTVATFLEDMLTSVTPEEAKGRDTRLMLELVDKATARVNTELKDQPLIAAWLQGILGIVYLKLGQYTNAEPLLRQALKVRERTLGKEHPDTLVSVINLATLLSLKADYAEAEQLYRKALETRERTLGKGHRETLGIINNLAVVLRNESDYAGAEPLFRQVLEAQEHRLGKEHPDTLRSLNNLAALLIDKGDYVAAEPLCRRALDASEHTLGKEHPDTLASVNNLALVLMKRRDYAGAEPLCRRALEARERTLGKEHPDMLNSLNTLANLLREKGDYAEAELLFRRVLEAGERTLGKEHPLTLTSMNDFADLLRAQKDYAGAELLFRRALEASERTLGKEHPLTLRSVNGLAGLLTDRSDYAGAEALYRRGLQARERRLGKEHPDTLASMKKLGRWLVEKGDYAGAEPLLREALVMQRKVRGSEHPEVAQSFFELWAVLWKQGKLAEAQAVARELFLVGLRTAGKTRSGYDPGRVVESLTKVIEEEPDAPGPYETRAFFLGRQGRWEAAAKDLSQSLKLDRAVHMPAFALNPLLVETGDTSGYNNRRRLASVTFGTTQDPETAGEAAMGMSLQPRDSGWSVPAQLAETAVTGGTNHIRLAYFQLVKGLVEYRQGRFDSAISWAQKSLGASGTNYTTAASAGAVLAMAQQQLKQSEEARKALAQATQVFETKLPKPESGDLGENWPEWLVARILVREAKGLIEGPGTPSGKP